MACVSLFHHWIVLLRASYIMCPRLWSCSLVLFPDPRIMWGLGLWQRWTWPIRERRAEPSPECRRLGPRAPKLKHTHTHVNPCNQAHTGITPAHTFTFGCTKAKLIFVKHVCAHIIWEMQRYDSKHKTTSHLKNKYTDTLVITTLGSQTASWPGRSHGKYRKTSSAANRC